MEAALIFGAVANPISCVPQSCTQVKSEEDARHALAGFLTSDNRASRKLISELREDGMKDEYLSDMQRGCRTCALFEGAEPQYNKNNWYVSTSIAPREDKRAVILEIPCADTVLLAYKLYGG